MKKFSTQAMVTQFKRAFDQTALNELGRIARFLKRERIVTPHRLAMSLIEAFAGGNLHSIADLQRAFNARCAEHVQYKPFHNQLAKRHFPDFMRLLLTRMMNDLAVDVLRFAADSPFARFRHIRLQDGTSFAVKASLAEHFPGRFTTISPAAVELHVNMDLLTESMHSVMLSADCEAEGQFLPAPADLTGDLCLADRGYFDKNYCSDVDRAQGHFIVRGKINLNPVILHAYDDSGREIKCWRGQRLKDVVHKLNRREGVDLDVRFDSNAGPFDCRLLANPNPREDQPRYLVTNLARGEFSPAQISDAYRLRWQIELLFKEWKSFTNLKAFDTSNPAIAEGLIWASLCAATLSRYCAHMTQRLMHRAISTRRVAMCIHHVLRDIVHAVLNAPRKLTGAVLRAMTYLSANAQRAHPKRDARTGRLKLKLHHVGVPLKN